LKNPLLFFQLSALKYIILVCDGAADWPIPALNNKTILESANIPTLHWLASHGRMGLFKTIPDSMKPGSEVANMNIMGYNPETDLTGRGPLEALSAGVPMESHHLAFRCNLITIEDGNIQDYSSGHITSEESRPLIEYIHSQFHEQGVDFYPGVQYRHILRLDGTRFSEDIICTPPHDVMDQPYEKYLIKPKNLEDKKAVETARYLNELIEKSRDLLTAHPINQKRKSEGKRMATNIWVWGGGKRPNVVPFKEKFGLSGGVISAVDLIFGIGAAVGLRPIHVDGATGLLDSNFEGKVHAAIEELKKNDFVYVHVEAPDEMGHSGDCNKKIQAMEIFDSRVVKPLLEAEAQFNHELVICILPDHPTPCQIRTHSREPIPFIIYNPKSANIRTKDRLFCEKSGEQGELGLITSGEQLIKLMKA
jgi:2,3-bisphosphoglycerate-independent phosphoglycerate mutase